ncbi:MAG TPA: hotdog fold thioesterase [Edaphocola sp.]|nr:hotdog fold thioesterase [Edaphocola sp.]
MSTPSNKARQIYEKMMEKDRFTAWLGLQLDAIEEGRCQMHLTLKPEMSNGFGSVHGGILFAAADSVFAFACNSHGLVAVALEASVHFLRPAFPGDTLTLKADLIFLGKRTGVYEVKTFNEQNELVSLFKGTAHRSKKPALPE